jgi:hypothetical protein
MIEGPASPFSSSPLTRKRAFRPHDKFSPADDEQLRFLVEAHGPKNWAAIADEMDGKTARQCKERWQNYLAPSLNTAPWTCAEDKLLMEKFQAFGSKWVRISKFFENRTDSMLKNRYNRLQRRKDKRRPRQENVEQATTASSTAPVTSPDDPDSRARIPAPAPSEDPWSVDLTAGIDDAFAVATWGQTDTFGCGFGGGIDDWLRFDSGF